MPSSLLCVFQAGASYKALLVVPLPIPPVTSMLIVATSGIGYVLGSGNAIDFAGLCWTCVGTMMVLTP
ncbi:hypothetical protein SLEP1_g14722 [Rubroshorea leprosula]|uniref:Uncharacterized protein n=1 Tax=Rubroshorea leprosula TaxID=152421 RepID=A0AAV5ITW4_9ROSI|nr:hypothetical protein SLEP1_g14722 [Rubroshorea leprosula]